MVEIEFGGGGSRRSKTEEAVLSAWTAFFSHANTVANGARWADQFNDLMNELLVAIGKDVGYALKTSDLKWHTYSPQGHMQDEIAVRELRDSVGKVFRGERVLAVEVRPAKEAAAAAAPVAGSAQGGAQ